MKKKKKKELKKIKKKTSKKPNEKIIFSYKKTCTNVLEEKKPFDFIFKKSIGDIFKNI